MIPRKVTGDVVNALARQAAVALIGPRQVGKTTLALAIGGERGALWCTRCSVLRPWSISAAIRLWGRAGKAL